MSRYVVSLDELQSKYEEQIAYHRRNAERWKEGALNGGRVSGVQGRQAKSYCIQKQVEHTAAANAYSDVLQDVLAIVAVEDFDETFGNMAEKLIEKWGGEAITVLRSGGRVNAAEAMKAGKLLDNVEQQLELLREDDPSKDEYAPGNDRSPGEWIDAIREENNL